MKKLAPIQAQYPISIDEQGQTYPNTLQHKQYPPPHSLTLQSTDHCPEKWVKGRPYIT